MTDVIAEAPLFFEPWVGPQYRSAGLDRCRLLILGESHYGSEKWDPPGEFTRAVIKRWAIDGPTGRFFTVTCRLVRGGEIPSVEQRTSFWNSVAFFNYVQDWVGEQPRDRPKPEQWAKSAEPFRRVLRELQPHAILVLGQDLWWHVSQAVTPAKPAHAPAGSPLSELPGFEPKPLACAVNHPSSAGFQYEKWRPSVDALLRACRTA
jgi:hypothetical protein